MPVIGCQYVRTDMWATVGTSLGRENDWLLRWFEGLALGPRDRELQCAEG